MTGLQHDVKGYLTPIIAGSPSLLKGDGVFSNKEKDGIYLNKDGVRTIEIFERSAIAARDQAEDFLAIAKFRTGKPVVSLESDIEISSTLDELVNLFKHEAEQKGIAIKFEKPEKKFFVSADETKLKSALRNVIGNSMKYTREGWVLVDLEEKGNNKILIKVQDTGIGIEPEKISTLFGSPFERTQEAKKTASGAGFGLYFASLIIGLHNGKIWAESKGNDKGSTFYIELPISQKID
jgi:signal transduction histidine kinase